MLCYNVMLVILSVVSVFKHVVRRLDVVIAVVVVVYSCVLCSYVYTTAAVFYVGMGGLPPAVFAVYSCVLCRSGRTTSCFCCCLELCSI